MKRFIITFTALLMFSATSVETHATQKVIVSNACEIEYQVGYNRAFQEEYVKSQDLVAAQEMGASGGYTALLICLEEYFETLF